MNALWSGPDLEEATGGRLEVPFAATGVSIDTRTLRPGDLFVALIGDNGDGHRFVADALAKGAAGAMVHRVPEGVAAGAPLLLVDDTLAGLHRLGAYARARFAGHVVAITGSVGKTTTKEMLRAVLAAAGTTWGAEASHNNQWGVPLTLARLPASAAFCIVEIGMNHAGEIAPLARLARPHVALVNAVERAHVGHLGSIEAIADEKISIAQGLEGGGVLLLPADSPLLRRMLAAACGIETRIFGAAEEADARLVATTSDAEHNEIRAAIFGTPVSTMLHAPGRHMAMNAVAALATAAALGIAPELGAAALAGFTPVGGRGARRFIPVAGGQALLLDESYNASAISVRSALSVLSLQPATRRIAVFGDMLELGNDGPGEHVGLAGDVVANADLLFTCGPLMRLLYEAIPPAKRGAHAADSASLAPLVAAAVRPGDAVLVKGSLGSRMKIIVQALAAPPTGQRAESR